MEQGLLLLLNPWYSLVGTAGRAGELWQPKAGLLCTRKVPSLWSHSHKVPPARGRGHAIRTCWTSNPELFQKPRPHNYIPCLIKGLFKRQKEKRLFPVLLPHLASDLGSPWSNNKPCSNLVRTMRRRGSLRGTGVKITPERKEHGWLWTFHDKGLAIIE